MKKFIITLVLNLIILGIVFSQNNYSIPLIGSKAPSFKANSTNGKITFPDDFGKSWKILFSHPQDFTPVCSTELLELAFRQEEFKNFDVKIAVISTDDVDRHNAWKSKLESMNYKGRGKQIIEYPIIDDHDVSASKLYGMIHPEASTNKDVRGVFVIDPNNIVRAVNFYPMQIGRNMDEIERLVVALQVADLVKILTPANWEIGDDLLVPYFPYTEQDLAINPSLKNEFYTVDDFLWFKKFGIKPNFKTGK